jgi:hypothetical protein
MHCHTLNHEDIGMMQRVDILPGQGKPSGCVPEVHSALPKIERPLARQGKFPFRGVLRQSKPVTDGSGFADTGQ